AREPHAASARLQLDAVAVGIAEVEGGAGAPRAEAVADLALQLHALRAQRVGHLPEIVAADRQADVVHAGAAVALARQDVDELLAEAEVDQGERRVDALERAAEDVDVELLRQGLVAHAQDDVVEAERRELVHGAIEP